MPKIKLPRKSTHIDMTAMCDVAFLLLTFFMLATKFKPEESVTVMTPASTSTKQIKEGFMQVTLDAKGRVFFTVDNLNDKRAIISQINEEKNLGLNAAEQQAFVTGGGIGVPFGQLKSYLAMAPDKRKNFDKTNAPGIPTDTTASFESNELAYWLQKSRYIVEGGRGRIVIKADGKAAYPEIAKVISTLGKQKVFRFSFLTDMKGVPPGTALAEERAKNPTE
jgi:biopolymer transport protein ExbD